VSILLTPSWPPARPQVASGLQGTTRYSQRAAISHNDMAQMAGLLRHEWNGSGPLRGRNKLGQDRQIDMQPHPLNPAHPEVSVVYQCPHFRPEMWVSPYAGRAAPPP